MKRARELWPLTNDHHHALLLAITARKTAEGRNERSVEDVWNEILQRFEDEIEPHFVLEEELLAPRLEELGEHELLQRFWEDHRLLREMVAPDAPRGVESLAAFAREMDRHVRFEERQLYEVIQERLPAEQLRAIQLACDAGRGDDA